ncbi:stress response protein SCP2 [Acinetobacter calcoaceticus]|uniref:Stress response protein SCP2 n=1 Tax=Acinetobacter calcoaceticus TaxID=471 RepID=A0A4R1XW14_ACICA|nr:stress response protein SCP2 [Acinetobacter calcoaceticus]
MQLQFGQRQPLANIIGDALDFEIHVSFQAGFNLDLSTFGLTAADKLYHDDFMTFFNQPVAPNQVVQFEQQGAVQVFKFDLKRHQQSEVQKFTLCAAIDDPTACMRNIQAGKVELRRNGQVLASFHLSPEQFAAEKAVMLVQFYLHAATWRMAVIGQGFNGGLAALVEHFGAEVAQQAPNDSAATSAAPAVTLSKLDLKKKIILDKVEKASPRLLDLTKKSLISLEKNNLLGVVARVGLVLDRSGSMYNQYKLGDVQKVIDRVLPLAMNFDDDGSFECWAFGKKNIRLDDVSLNNVNNYVESTQGGWRKWNIGSAVNYEPAAIEDVMQHYAQFNDNIPTYIVFISDGGIYENRKITKLITDAAHRPIFWQFIGIGGNNYGILEKLDDMSGRIVDNCNFFSLDHIEQTSDEQLYDLLLQEFPMWLKAAQQKNIVAKT